MAETINKEFFEDKLKKATVLQRESQPLYRLILSVIKSWGESKNPGVCTFGDEQMKLLPPKPSPRATIEGTPMANNRTLLALRCDDSDWFNIIFDNDTKQPRMSEIGDLTVGRFQNVIYARRDGFYVHWKPFGNKEITQFGTSTYTIVMDYEDRKALVSQISFPNDTIEIPF